jgi:glycosyltransferase involved in cell wall biosynthesis
MIDDLRHHRIALAHDWLVGMRGGEYVLDRLARLFGPAELYTLVRSGQPMSEAIDACRVITSPLQRFPGASGNLRRWYLPLMPWAVGRLRVAPCDLLISTSSAVMQAIRPPAGVPHLCYCHSPARYIWEQTDDYIHGARGGLRSIGLRAIRRRFQRWDRTAAQRVTQILANSRHTAQRIERCYEREAHVVHPPVRTAFFTPDASVRREDWLLVVAALEPYKRTDVVVEAANRAKLALRIAGSGSQLEALRAMAGPTVELLGRVDDQTLRDLYRRAKALVFPQVEDFGIIAVEAQATGCPVLAFAAGGALETVTQESGVFFYAQTPEAIISAVRELVCRKLDPATCRAQAERFGEHVFDAAIIRHVSTMVA